MDCVEKCMENFQQLFGNGVTTTYSTDPEFQDILSHFIFGEGFYQDI